MLKLFFRALGNITIAALTVLLIVSCQRKMDEGEMTKEEQAKIQKEFEDFSKKFEAKIKPLYSNYSLEYYTASISGKDEDWEKSTEFEKQLNEMYSNKNDFAIIKKIFESKAITDEVGKRYIQVLYNVYKMNQIDTAKLNAMTELQTEISKKFNTFRAEVGKKKYTDNDVEEVLKNSTNNKELEAVWIAHKKIGPVVAADILKLVKMRNEAARELGFNNYHEMQLKLNEQDPAEVEKIFDELDNLTRKGFIQLKSEMDSVLAARLEIKPEELMPWDYQNRYFQEAPKIYSVDLDKYYKDKNIEDITKKYYAGIELPIDDMVAKSDLYEKEGKNQHAYCIDINRDTKDVRVLCNIKPNARWMETMLHEFGHAVYQKYVDQKLPWLLKTQAHIFTTEGIAMMFGRFATSPQWMSEMIGLSQTEKDNITPVCKKILRLQELVFSRWAQVMYRFEKSMYANPDQDLNKLWWDIVEKYQMIKKPVGRNEPDWATKTHIASSPCYYHNYLLGALFASQFYNYIVTKVMKMGAGTDTGYTNHKEVGQYLIDYVFNPANHYYWNDMIKRATSEKLTPKYYAMQFVN